MIRQIFSDHKDRLSSSRVKSFVALIAVIGMAFYGLYKGVDLIGLSALCGAFLGAAFGAQAYQKKIELQNGDK